MGFGLPEDILHLICDELQLREDYATLFNCAITNKQFAPIALSHLYRMHKSPANDEETEGLGPAVEQEQLVQRWSILWRSVCLAALGKTMFPYHRYLRWLNLTDLESLLDDGLFSGNIERAFFSGILAGYHHQTEGSYRRGNIMRLDLPPILEAIGEVITSKTEAIEQVSGKMSSEAFLRWIPRLPRLKRLAPYYGEVLADEKVHRAIYEHCPNLEALTIYQWLDANSDSHLGAFIEGLRPHSLRDFTIHSICGISTETALALNSHGHSLKKLQLNFQHYTVQALALLSGCTAIERLHLEIPSTVDLENSHKEVFEELIGWLGACKRLKEVTLSGFKSGPAILTPILFSDELQLEELTLNAQKALYNVADTRDFHLALAHQQSLRTLRLVGDTDGVIAEDTDSLVESVRKLTRLTTLELRGVADDFKDEEIIRLLSPLHALEEVSIGGWNISDAILDTVASLRNLRAITFIAMTTFTISGLLDFISKLAPNTEGFRMSMDYADPGNLLGDEELALVREVLWQKNHGKLDYEPLRDPNMSEFEGESD